MLNNPRDKQIADFVSFVNILKTMQETSTALSEPTQTIPSDHEAFARYLIGAFSEAHRLTSEADQSPFERIRPTDPVRPTEFLFYRIVNTELPSPRFFDDDEE